MNVDIVGRSASLRDGERLSYDTLIVAVGSRTHYYGRDEWASVAPGLKTIEDAVEIRRRVLGAFETAHSATDWAVNWWRASDVRVMDAEALVLFAGVICADRSSWTASSAA